jgi:hypothetical protein
LPGGTVDASFAGRPPLQRAIYDALVAHLSTLGPLHEDAVRVGVFLKAQRKLADVRPKQRWLSVALYLPRRVEDPRITRHLVVSPSRIVHGIKLHTLDDVDQQVLAWATEAYDNAR